MSKTRLSKLSDESITYKEDTENLQYIARKIHLQDLVFAEESYLRESYQKSSSSSENLTNLESDFQLLENFKTRGPGLLKYPEIVAKTCPFNVKWSFGVNKGMNIKNLTTETKSQIFFSSSHFPIVYDYCKKQMQLLPGHTSPIRDLSADLSGTYLVSVGEGQHGLVVIWENKDHEVKPIYKLYNPYQEGMWMAKITWTGKVLFVLGEDEDCYRLDIYWWTYGNLEPEDSYKIEKNWGQPKSVILHRNYDECVMIIFEMHVLFLTLDLVEKRFKNPVIPALPHQSKFGSLIDACYLLGSHDCVVCTTNGYLLVFGDSLYHKPFDKEKISNMKMYRNAVRISPVAVHCMSTVQDYIITGDARGYIQFFDNKLRIVYWLKDMQIEPIVYIVFNNLQKQTWEDSETIEIVNYVDDNGNYRCQDQDRVQLTERIMKKDLPTDASLERRPVTFKDCFIVTSDGNIYCVDCIRNTCSLLFEGSEAKATAIDSHSEENYVIFGYVDGTIRLMDFEKKEIIHTNKLPNNSDGRNEITTIKYSIESLHLVCGRENGEIWILEPILVTPKCNTPFCTTMSKIVKLAFSQVPLQFAYYDANRTVGLFSYNLEANKWDFIGKIRSHLCEITDIMFIPGISTNCCKLYTISKDQNLIEYNNDKYLSEEFNAMNINRIDQFAKPLCFTYWTEVEEETIKPFILVADDHHKFKFIHQSTKIPKMTALGPAFGCFEKQFIKKMKILPSNDVKYMVFCTQRHIGLHLLPIDGNPYKYVGYLAHTGGIKDFALSSNGKYLFTFGSGDGSVFMWEIEKRAVDLLHVLGGKELQPYYCLIEGGHDGWLFNEIKDLFYYMQILSQDNKDMLRRVSDTVSINDLPDLVRTCGYFPSEYELENMMIEAKYKNYDQTQKLNEDINFTDFIKLYCNHKPAYGYSLSQIEDAWRVIDETFDGMDQIDRDDFIGILTSHGEPFTINNTLKSLKALLRANENEEDFEFVPETITCKILCDEILGIDMLREKTVNIENSQNSCSESEEEEIFNEKR